MIGRGMMTMVGVAWSLFAFGLGSPQTPPPSRCTLPLDACQIIESETASAQVNEVRPQIDLRATSPRKRPAVQPAPPPVAPHSVAEVHRLNHPLR